MSSPRSQIKPGIVSLGTAVLFALGLLLLGRCDSSFVPDVGPSGNTADRVQAVRLWYEDALSRQQDALPALSDGSGKISDDSTTAAVLAAMVRQYPPDWDKAVTWSNGTGGYYAAALLGSDKPATSFSHDKIAVVRTLIADTDADGKVIGGRLVEFISPDPLDPSLFQDYAKQWLTGDFDDTKMLAAEYTIGYAQEQAFLYAPGDSVLVPKSVRLERRSGAGKTQSKEMFCWVSDVDEWEICSCLGPDENPEPSEWSEECPDEEQIVCNSGVAIEITCVSLEDDGGGDLVDPCVADPSACGPDGDDEEEEEEEDEDECPDTCTQQQCDLAEEYNDPAGWPCTKFHIGTRFVISGPNDEGTEYGRHNGYGYEAPSLVTGFGNMESAFNRYAPFTISSGYRCPIGNGLAGGASGSSHVEGRGVDFTGYVKDRSGLWPNGTNVAEKLEIRDWAQRPENKYYFESYATKTHVHLSFH